MDAFPPRPAAAPARRCGAVCPARCARGSRRCSALLLLLLAVPSFGAAMRPQTSRGLPLRGRARPPLPEGRGAVLSAATVSRRARLLPEFRSFLQDLCFEELLADPKALGQQLVAYGRDLYACLRPLGDYTETVNAVIDADRTLRRFLTPAWDLAGLWRAMEPPEHRLAMPPLILLAFVSVALAWGWPKFASLISLGWTAFLRPSEFLTARREHICLPRDSLRDEPHAWLRIPAPKARFRGAREQLARCDEVWVARLLDALYCSGPRTERLWPASYSSFRRRWGAVGASSGSRRPRAEESLPTACAAAKQPGPHPTTAPSPLAAARHLANLCVGGLPRRVPRRPPGVDPRQAAPGRGSPCDGRRSARPPARPSALHSFVLSSVFSLRPRAFAARGRGGGGPGIRSPA